MGYRGVNGQGMKRGVKNIWSTEEYEKISTGRGHRPRAGAFGESGWRENEE